MISQTPPTTIAELWYALDKRLSLIEASQIDHCATHTIVQKILDDHESRLRSGLTFTAIMTGGGGLVALIAIIKSFFSP
jgi:hypothetical protein